MASIAHNNVSCSLGFGSLIHYKFKRPIHDYNTRTRSLCTQGSVHQKSGRIVRAMASSTVSAPKREKDPKKRVVITGMGLVSVFGNDVDMFYDKLLEGESGIGPINKFVASSFSVQFAGQIHNFSSEGYIDMKNGSRFDDCMRYCIVASKKALENANLGPQSLENMDKMRIGVLVGSGFGGASTITKSLENFFKDEKKKKNIKMSPFSLPFSMPNIGSAMLAIDTGLMGPNYSISTACATSNHCFISAANHIIKGDADIMVAGGVDACINPTVVGGFITCKALSSRNEDPTRASRPWDKDRNGFVMGEGAGVLVMESLHSAMKRGTNIVAEYLGGATTFAAHHITNPRPDEIEISNCISKSLECARISSEEVNYVNCHATSTQAGDLVEINAMKQIFKDTRQMKMNATKSIIGHALGGSGGLEAIATIKAINTGWLHPTLNQNDLEPEVMEIDTIPNVKKRHQINVAISNSFGFGGQNAVIVLAPFTP